MTPRRSLLILICCFAGATAHAALTDYVWQKESTRNIGPGAASIVADLEAHLDEMLTVNAVQAVFYKNGVVGDFYLYGAPTETVYTLCDAYPLVSTAMQGRIRTYLQTYMQAYPPLDRSLIHGNSTWGDVQLSAFAPRAEYYPMPAGIHVNVWPPPGVPIETLYALWRYADTTGDWAYIQSHWTQIQSLYNSYQAPAQRYGDIIGLIGMARLAQQLSATDATKTAVAQDAETKAVAAMQASNYSVFLSSAQATMTRWGHDWCYPLFHSVRNGISVQAFFAPEIGRFIADNQKSDALTTLSLILGINPGDEAQASYPGWYVYRADHCYVEFINKSVPWMVRNAQGVNAVTMMQGGENPYNPPDFAWTFYMLRAYVLGDSAADLKQALDSPSCIGDLFYMQRLTTAIRAFGTRSWVDVRAAANSTPPAAPKNLRFR